MMHLWLPMLLAAVLAGTGVYGILARRNAVLVLIGVELVLNAANLLLVALGAADSSPLQTGQTLALFVITIAAAEICVALAIVLAMFRLQGHIDLARAASTEDTKDTDDTDDTEDTGDTDDTEDTEVTEDPAPVAPLTMAPGGGG
ncbi:MAG: NADH-quinone oxidoreductase subunit NuoK [Actinomycetota bacterium]|nr:NADH-quinone oxidoreductase subunit NuoK [Actinomycetota bacterium]